MEKKIWQERPKKSPQEWRRLREVMNESISLNKDRFGYEQAVKEKKESLLQQYPNAELYCSQTTKNRTRLTVYVLK